MEQVRNVPNVLVAWPMVVSISVLPPGPQIQCILALVTYLILHSDPVGRDEIELLWKEGAFVVNWVLHLLQGLFALVVIQKTQNLRNSDGTSAAWFHLCAQECRDHCFPSQPKAAFRMHGCQAMGITGNFL